MELHELLGRAKSDSTMALSYLETALRKVEEEEDRIADKEPEGAWTDDMVKMRDFITALEEVVCDVKHVIPQIQILMEDL